MNKLNSSILALVLLAFTCFIASCDGNEPSENTPDVQALLTSGIWKMNSVTVDGVNKNDLYTNFAVSFTSTGFTSSNGEPVWSTSGTWTFTNSDQKSFIRNDGIEVTLDDISETELTLKLMWSKTTLGSGRVGSTSGNHTFVFSK